MSNTQMDWRVQDRRWILVRRGVHRIAGAPETWEQGPMAACLAAGPGASSSHLTGLAVWRFPQIALPEQLAITTFSGAQSKLPGVKVHRVIRPDDRHRTVYNQIPVTTVARTLIDVGPLVSPYLLERLVDTARQRRLVTYAELEREVAWLRESRRRGLKPIEGVLALRVDGAERDDSPMEKHGIRWLIEAGLPRPVQQFQVVIGGRVFVIDLAYPQWKIAIEWKGWDPHGQRYVFDHDQERERLLTLAGWLVLGFTAKTAQRAYVADVEAAIQLRGKNARL